MSIPQWDIPPCCSLDPPLLVCATDEGLGVLAGAGRLSVLIGSTCCLLIVAVVSTVVVVTVRRCCRHVSKPPDAVPESNSYDNLPGPTPSPAGARDTAGDSDGHRSPAVVYANTTSDCGTPSLYQPLSMATRGEEVVYDELKKKNQAAAAAAADVNGDSSRSDASNVYVNGLSCQPSVYQSLAVISEHEPIYAALKNKKLGVFWRKKK